MAKGGPDSLLSPIPCGKDRSFLSYTNGKAMAAQVSPNPVHLLLVHERKIEWQYDTDSSKPIPIRASKGHLVKTMFYDE